MCLGRSLLEHRCLLLNTNQGPHNSLELLSMNFSLPPEITVKKCQLDGHWVYGFRHDTLGELGMIILQNLPNGHCNVASEVSGEPDDPMTEIRLNIFQPISEQITAVMEATLGEGDQALLKAAPASPQGPGEIVESKLMPCDRCGEPAAMLIFAYDATTTGDFEDCARKMYHEYRDLDIPTWIIGEPLGTPGFETPSRILKVSPHRESIQNMTPNAFNSALEVLVAKHCR